MPTSESAGASSAEEGELAQQAGRRRARSRARSRSPPPDKRARYWAERAPPSGDRYPRGARYYQEGSEPQESAVKPERKERGTEAEQALRTRTGGAYIPPARLRLLQAQITDKGSAAYQRIAWEALKKSIHGHINKINVGNIGIIIKQLLRENIVRGRGLLCRSIVQAQAASPTFTNVYAALVAAVNSRFPNVGELLLKRLIIQFKRGFKRNDKSICISAATFVAHLVNQRVAHEILALELLTLLVETPTDDSVEVAIAFLKECGQKLTEVSSKGVNAIFEMLRNILHEGQLDKRVQYMIEVIFQIWKDGFKDHLAVIDELELVPETEQFTHLMMLDEATDAQDLLNVFKFDEKYEENEQKYKELSKEILGSDAESGSEEGSGSGSGSEESSDGEEGDDDKPQAGVTIIDNTETNLIALRRTIYLTINSSLDFEECAHKLMKMQLKPGQEIELCHMFLDCCAEQRTYEKFYGLLAQRFCQINKIYIGPFEEIFRDSYSTAHRLDTNRLRNVSKFFAHLFFTDSISWEALECVKLNEEDTTSSSRIYIKILFQELAEYMGLKKLNDRLRDVTLQEAFQGLFPRDNPKNTRFSINFFTSIGLGGLTDDLREHLKQLPKTAPQTLTEINVTESSSSSSSSDTDSSTSSSEDSSSESEEEKEKSKKNTTNSKKSKKSHKSASDSEGDDEESSKKKKSSKKSKKNKKRKSASPEKEQEKDKENERWGHDGFYETYGSNAVRNPKRNDRQDNIRNERNKGRQERDTQNDRSEANLREDLERPRNQDNWDIRRDSSIRRDIEPRKGYWDIRREGSIRERDSDKERDKDWDIRREGSVRDRDTGRNREAWDIRREGSERDRDSGRDRDKDWDIRRDSSMRRECEPSKNRDKDWDIRRESSMRRERRDSGDGRDNDDRKQQKERRSSKDRDDFDIRRESSLRREFRKEKSTKDDSDKRDGGKRERDSSKDRDKRRDRRPPVPSDWERQRKPR